MNSCQSNQDEIDLPEDVTGTLKIFESNNVQKKQDQNRSEFTFSIDGTEEVIKFEAFVADSIIISTLTFSRNSTILVENSLKVDMANKGWRKELNKTVEEKAEVLKEKTTEELISKIDNVIA